MNLDIFMADNVERLPDKEVVISERFKVDDEPVKWKFRPISAEQSDQLMEKAMRFDNNGNFDFDPIVFAKLLTAESIVYPDLKNASLQDSYGVTSPEELLTVMLYSGEYAKASKTAQEINQVNDLDTLAGEVKNE